MSAKILRFPVHHASCNDRDGGLGSSNQSAEITPLVCLMSGSRHLYGTFFRCRHFSSANSPTPRERPAISTTSQLILLFAMTWIYADNWSAGQGELGSGLSALDFLEFLLSTWGIPMTDKDEMVNAAEEAEEIALHKRIKQRMKNLRDARGWNQQRMAEFLGISKENYQKYEYDSPDQPFRKVPLIVLRNFCDNAGIDIDDILFPGRKPKRA
jgi:DNA-binding XRE family transcriptional regulator